MQKVKKQANTQDAHEAVRPTSTLREPSAVKASLSRDQYRLYKLIWERYVASQMAPAIMDTVRVDLKNGDVVFRATGSQIKFPGFMKVYVESTDDQQEEKENMLPDLAEGDQVSTDKLDSEPAFHTTAATVHGSKAC